MVLAESFADGTVAAAENPVDDFALTHDKEVVEAEIAAVDHGFDDIGSELDDETGFVTVVNDELGQSSLDKISTDVEVFETELVETTFVFENGEVTVILLDLGEVEGIEEEETIAKSILKPVGGEARSFIVGNGIEMKIGDLGDEDTVALELAGDDARVADDFCGVFFERLLALGIAIHVVDNVFESGRGNIMEKSSESLDFVVSEVPDDEGDADAVLEDGVETGEIIESIVVDIDHADAGETLDFWGGDIFE